MDKETFELCSSAGEVGFSILAARLGAIFLLVAAAPLAAQGNDVPLHNDEDGFFRLLSNPSVGAPPGAFPPDLSGDLSWRVLPGDRVLAHTGPDGEVMVLDGWVQFIADTDFSTEPWFYDILVGPALPSVTNPGNLEPAFLQLGLTTEVFISLGPSGLPDPCVIAPESCNPDGCLWGGVPSYLVNIQFDPGIVVPADGTSSSDLAVTLFFPGGMTIPDLSAPCAGASDFVFQDVHTTSETQADDLGGISALGGWQIAGSGPSADPVTDTMRMNITFQERILNVIADSGTGLGLERGTNGGGATNALKLSVGGGVARFSYEVRSLQDVGIANQAFAATSLSPLPLPGLSFFGASLLIAPDALFMWTRSQTAAAMLSVIDAASFDADYVFGPGSDGAADFATPFALGTPVVLKVPASAVGLDIYSQGGVLHLVDHTAYHTNRVRTSLLP